MTYKSNCEFADEIPDIKKNQSHLWKVASWYAHHECDKRKSVCVQDELQLNMHDITECSLQKIDERRLSLITMKTLCLYYVRLNSDSA
ncbi:hypothetical protein J6590_105437 [Homalodisca vitripennis]|nr:hypothetical protein J6590_105437 [Homalodisca vitripennis]